MKYLLNVLVTFFSLVFLFVGLCWAVAPSIASSFLGMTLMEGLGLSSQIGDVGAFFLGAGTFIALGIKTQNFVWYNAAALLVGLASMMRLIAWVAHDALFAFEQIIAEIVIVVVLVVTSRRKIGRSG